MADKEENADAAKAINWQPRTVQDAAIDEIAGLDKGQDDLPDPANESADEKEKDVI